jgi:hydroxyacylglutathione hydrolase
VPHLPALAHRRARPLLRRHPVQRRRRQLPQRRQPGDLYNTFVEQLAKLPENTRVYPGHDYIENNLRFTLAREPDNAAAKALLPEVVGHDPATGRVTTMAEEKKVNTFLRLGSPSVIAALRAAFPDLPENPDPKTVFVKLRELRNSW